MVPRLLFQEYCSFTLPPILFSFKVFCLSCPSWCANIYICLCGRFTKCCRVWCTLGKSYSVASVSFTGKSIYSIRYKSSVITVSNKYQESHRYNYRRSNLFHISTIDLNCLFLKRNFEINTKFSVNWYQTYTHTFLFSQNFYWINKTFSYWMFRYVTSKGRPKGYAVRTAYFQEIFEKYRVRTAHLEEIKLWKKSNQEFRTFLEKLKSKNDEIFSLTKHLFMAVPNVNTVF